MSHRSHPHTHLYSTLRGLFNPAFSLHYHTRAHCLLQRLSMGEDVLAETHDCWNAFTPQQLHFQHVGNPHPGDEAVGDSFSQIGEIFFLSHFDEKPTACGRPQPSSSSVAAVTNRRTAGTRLLQMLIPGTCTYTCLTRILEFLCLKQDCY